MRRVMHRTLLASFCSVLAVPALEAQHAASPPAGVTAPSAALARPVTRSNHFPRDEQAVVGPVVASPFRRSDPGLAAPVPAPAAELRRGSSRWSRAGKGALWGLGVYAVGVGAYLLHEKLTCEYSCYGDGWAALGIVAWAPVAMGTGAVIGFMLPQRR